jgi:hypothetical protein
MSVVQTKVVKEIPTLSEKDFDVFSEDEDSDEDSDGDSEDDVIHVNNMVVDYNISDSD